MCGSWIDCVSQLVALIVEKVGWAKAHSRLSPPLRACAQPSPPHHLRRALRHLLEHRRRQHGVDVQRHRAGIAKTVAAAGGDDQRLAGGDDGAASSSHISASPDSTVSTSSTGWLWVGAPAPGASHCSKMQSCVAPLAAETQHPGFRARPPLFGRRVAGVDDVHGCALSICVGNARACERARNHPGKSRRSRDGGHVASRLCPPDVLRSITLRTRRRTE